MQTDTILSGAKLVDGRFTLADGSQIVSNRTPLSDGWLAAKPDGQWLTSQAGDGWSAKSFPSPQAAAEALRAAGYGPASVPSEPAQPAKPKLPNEIRGLYGSYKMCQSRNEFICGDNRLKFLDWAEATYDCSPEPEMPKKPELFLVTNGKECAWAVYEDDCGDFYLATDDAGKMWGLKREGWHRKEST